MALLGQAALAMWWDIAAEHRAAFEHWHSHEHFPERLSIPGFRRASRWAGAAGDGAYFVLYELDTYETLTSPPYLARLNAPTPWSVQMMPHHRNMVRSQCRVRHSHGGGIASHLWTLRLSPAPGQAAALEAHLGGLLGSLPVRPWLTGAHLLHTHTPAAPRTTEQALRGDADRVADWIVLVSGHAVATLRELAAGPLSGEALRVAGAASAQQQGLYRLDYASTPADL